MSIPDLSYLSAETTELLRNLDKDPYDEDQVECHVFPLIILYDAIVI